MSSSDETSDEQTMEDLKAAITALHGAGSVPPEAPWETLVEWEGEAATRALVALLNQGGQSAVHAVRILAERGDPAGVEPMVQRLVDPQADKLLHDEITFACQTFGRPAFEPLMEAWDGARERGEHDTMLRLLEAAFETGVVDRRMSEALAAQIEHHPAVIRQMLPAYAAVGAVVDVLEERAAEIAEISEELRPADEVLHTIVDIIQQSDGELPESLREEMRPVFESRTTTAEAFITGQI